MTCGSCPSGCSDWRTRRKIVSRLPLIPSSRALVCPSLASCKKPQVAECFLQPLGALSMRTAEIGKSFNKDLLSTNALFTDKTTHMHDETDWLPNRGKITQRPCIATLDARRYGPT